MFRVASFFLLIAGSLSLAGCGFQVAGQAPLPSYLDSVRLEADDKLSDVYLALERRLLKQGVEIRNDSPNRLQLGSVESGQRVLSVSVRNIPREYEVYYTVSYQFRRAGQLLLDRPALSLTRDYVWSELEVLGKVREEQQIRELIVDDLVDTIIRQLTTIE